MSKIKLYTGKMEIILQDFDSDSIDSIITDPPYGIKFKGLKWDYEIPSKYQFEQCFRVLKPGGTMLCFGGTRTWHRIACNIEDAGFYIQDTIMWVHGQGFPKSVDVAYQIDKKKKNGFGNVSKKMIVGNPMGDNKDKRTIEITEPKSDEAKKWNGWGTALKPAYEPILVCKKPIKGNYDENAINFGVCGFNIDGCRIKSSDPHFGIKRTQEGRFPSNIILDDDSSTFVDELFPQKNNKKITRFFYCAKPTKKEKGSYNTHKTVKPLKLMTYLNELTKTPTGGIVLDPFCGSGTTGLGSKLTGRSFIGIDVSDENVNITKKRLNDI